MLSALVHAGLVAREEWVIKREQAERSEHLQAAVDAMADVEVAQSNEQTPLLFGGGRRGRSLGGGRYS
jgi:hypothetical protein